jgi:antirestriction protein
MNTEKIAKYKKSLDNANIPANVKTKIEAEIKRLEDLDAKQKEASEKKEEAPASAPAKKTRAKRTPKATPSRTSTPKSTTRKKPTRTVMSVAKEIRKEGESWKDAQERARKMMKADATEVTKKVESELDKLNKLVRSRKELRGMSGKTDLLRDAKRKAKPRGARTVTHSGKTSNQYGTFSNKLGRKYYESRFEHSDKGTYGKYHLAEGGYLTDPTFGTFQNQVFADGGDVDIKKIDLGYHFEIVVTKHYYTDGKSTYGAELYYENKLFKFFAIIPNKTKKEAIDNVYDYIETLKVSDKINENAPQKGDFSVYYNDRGGEHRKIFDSKKEAQEFINLSNYLTSSKDAREYARGGGVDKPLKTYEIFKNGTQQGEVRATSLKEAKRKVFATYGEHRDVYEAEEDEEYARGGSVRNERRHVNHDEDYEVRYAKSRPSRTGYKGKRSFSGGGDTKQQLKKGDDVLIIGRRWFDKANGNTYHTAEVVVNDKVIGKSRMSYGYEEQYIQTGKEILLDHFELPKGMKESSPLWQLREYGVEFRKRVTDGLKRDLELGGTVVTDLAGHTGGGTGGLDAGMPLSGVTGTQYSGLVGETGAMSSGEMFARGGGVDKPLKTYEIFKNGTQQGEVQATSLAEAKRKVFSTYGEHRDVYEAEDEEYARGGGVRKVGNREYSYGRNWTNDHNHVNKGEEHEVSYKRKRSFADGGDVDGKEVIKLKVYAYSGNVIREGDFLINYNDSTITFPSGKTFKVVPDREYTIKMQKTQIKANRGIIGLADFIKDINTPDTPFKGLATDLIDLGKDGKYEFGGDFQAGVYADGGGIGDKKTKYVQVHIVQGKYGSQWDDLTAHDTYLEAKKEKKVYDENESYPHRVITRRVLRSDYEVGNYADGGDFQAGVYANGGGVNDDTPRIYVADLEAYNNGRLVGEWLDLTDYKDADMLMKAIQEVLKKSGGEEYAIHDAENLPSGMYSEYMGASDFEELYVMIDLSIEQNLPLSVVQDIVSQYDTNAVYEFNGRYESADDFAQQLVDDLGGIQNFYNFERYLIVSETDRRLLAQENADMYVDDIAYEDGGNRIIEEAELDLEEYEEADSDRQEEMLDEAKEIVYDRLYNEWYDGLSDPYYFLVEEQGIYGAEDFANASFVQVDYEDLGDALEDDYAYIYYNSDLYVFNVK